MSHNQIQVPDASAMTTKTGASCVETGTFTDLPVPPPANMALDYAVVNSAMNQQIIGAGRMTFQVTGCAGDPNNPAQGQCVGEGMASQIASPPAGAAVPAFFYNLGDVAYKHGDPTNNSDAVVDLSALWNSQFYNQYRSYRYPANGANPAVPAPIFAVAGNHDAKTSSHSAKDEIGHFLTNMCGTAGTLSPDNQTQDGRTEMSQPYPYWLLETPLATIVGLHTNDTNGGILDDPHTYHDPYTGPQFTWLVSQLSRAKQQNSAGGEPYKAVLLMLHYPPFSGTANFAQRGDPTLGPTQGAKHAVPLGTVLQEAYRRSKQIPDAVFSAHAHLYQRLTYTYNAAGPTQEVPYLVVGIGGHAPSESLLKSCSGGSPVSPPVMPMNLFASNPSVVPAGLTIPDSNTVFLKAYCDASNAPSATELPYGFLAVTIAAATFGSNATLTGSFYTMQYSGSGITSIPTLRDSFTLDLKTHLLVQG